MTYTSDSHIMSVKDVKTFFHHIVSERKVNFHPDDMFEDYVSCEGGINTFTLGECAIYNRLMDESFAVCNNEGVDIYAIGLEELQTVTIQRMPAQFHFLMVISIMTLFKCLSISKISMEIVLFLFAYLSYFFVPLYL